MLSDTTLRRPRALFAIGLFIFCVTILLSYTRIKSSASSLFLEINPDTETNPVPALTEEEASDYKTIFEDLAPMEYGTAARPPTKGMPERLVETLPEKYIPTALGEDQDGARRLVIVGDVHGQKKALQKLLDKVEFDNGKGDHLILVGDLINKGPDSAGVVALAMELGAHAVRGNHEDRILLTHASMASQTSTSDIDATTQVFDEFHVSEPEPAPGATDSKAAVEAYQADEAALAKGDRRDRKTLATLTPAQIEWLANLPVILQIGPVPLGVDEPTFENLVVCHAGLVPHVSLDNQDPWAVMNMRTITYPIDELRRDAVSTYLKEKVRQGEHRGQGAALQRIDAARVDRELAKIMKAQGLEDREGDAALPSSGRDGTFWYEEWSRLQAKVAKQNKEAAKDNEANKATVPVTTVVYGHDAKSGLKVPDEFGKGKKGYTFGLDSGCGSGKKLTAMVIEMKKHKAKAKYEIVQVGCDPIADK